MHPLQPADGFTSELTRGTLTDCRSVWLGFVFVWRGELALKLFWKLCWGPDHHIKWLQTSAESLLHFSCDKTEDQLPGTALVSVTGLQIQDRMRLKRAQKDLSHLSYQNPSSAHVLNWNLFTTLRRKKKKHILLLLPALVYLLVHPNEGRNPDCKSKAAAYLLSQFKQQHVAGPMRGGTYCI